MNYRVRDLRWRGRLGVVLGLGVVVLIAVASPAVAAHFSGADSVDGGEIRYEENTKYNVTFAHAKEQWNDVGSVDLKADSATSNADLEFVDQYKPTAAWGGQYANRPWPAIDQVRLNTDYMDNTSANNMKNVMVHETGHAYGIDDHSSPSWNAIMYEVVRGWTQVHSHDEADYNSLW